jgi:hypothetical protein
MPPTTTAIIITNATTHPAPPLPSLSGEFVIIVSAIKLQKVNNNLSYIVTTYIII